MTKDELLAANERLGAQVAALRELLTVIGGAKPPEPADGERNYQLHGFACRDRLSAVAIISRCAMDYAASTNFTPVLRSSAASLRKVLDEPLRYATEAAPAPSAQGTAAEMAVTR